MTSCFSFTLWMNLIWLNGCFYLQLLILQQSYHQCPDIIHCFLVTHEGEQVVKNHNLEVCEHRVSSVPGAAASNLQTTTNPSHVNNILWALFSQEEQTMPWMSTSFRFFVMELEVPPILKMYTISNWLQQLNQNLCARTSPSSRPLHVSHQSVAQN